MRTALVRGLSSSLSDLSFSTKSCWSFEKSMLRQCRLQASGISTGKGGGRGRKRERPTYDRERKLEASALAQEWTGYEDLIRQGLHDLGGPTGSGRRDGNYVKLPLATADEDEEDEIRREQAQEAFASDVERVWSKIFFEDSRAGMPKATLPGFPIEVNRFSKRVGEKIDSKICLPYSHLYAPHICEKGLLPGVENGNGHAIF
ncbi:unnamed protein product [Choristocarpus tenellus]